MKYLITIEDLPNGNVEVTQEAVDANLADGEPIVPTTDAGKILYACIGMLNNEYNNIKRPSHD